MIVITTMKTDTLKKLRTKVDQLWQIASRDACGKHVQAVAMLYHDIQRIFSELMNEETGKPLVEVFAEEERKNAEAIRSDSRFPDKQRNTDEGSQADCRCNL